MRLSDVQRADVMRLVETLQTEKSGSTVRNVIASLRVVFGRAVELGELTVNPCTGVRLPRARRRDAKEVPSPQEVRRLLPAVSDPDRPVWAVAALAGLPAGEMQALRWEDVELPREGRGRMRVAFLRSAGS